MHIYRIEKSRIPVVVTLGAGQALAGDVFVQGYAATHYGPESPSDVLNDGDDFFPLAISEDATMLVNKNHVRDVAETSTSREDWRLTPAWTQQRVDVSLVGGARLSGTVELELPGDQPRLLDFLNKSNARFLRLLTDDGSRLVNRAFIESISLVDHA